MIEENVLSDLGMYLLGQVHLSGLSVPNESSRNYCKVPNEYVIGHVLVGQNGGSTNMSIFGRDHECREYEWKHE